MGQAGDSSNAVVGLGGGPAAVKYPGPGGKIFQGYGNVTDDLAVGTELVADDAPAGQRSGEVSDVVGMGDDCDSA